MYSIPSRWSVSCWKIRARRPSPTSSYGEPSRSWPRHVTRAYRGVAWYGPGSTGSPPRGAHPRIEELRVRHEPRARLPVVEHEEPSGDPHLGPREADAGRVAHRLDHVGVELAERGPNSLTGVAGSRRTGSPSVRMRRITTAPSLATGRLRLDAVDGAVRRELTQPRPEHGHPVGVEGEQAYRPPLALGDEQGHGIEPAAPPPARRRP